MILKLQKFVFLNGPVPASFFVYFRSFLVTISIIQIEKSIDGVLRIRPRGRRMVGADETTELWRSPKTAIICLPPLSSLVQHLQIGMRIWPCST